MIERSVGSGGFNNHNDVLIVQCALNVWRSRNNLSFIAIDGLVGPETTGAIVTFQRRNSGLSTDGRIDAGGPTLARLTSLIGGEAFVFGPIVQQLLSLRADLERAATLAPQRTRGPLNRVMPGLNALTAHSDLAEGLGSLTPPVLIGFNPGPPKFGVVGVDDAAAAATLAMMALLMALFLVLLTQNPAFQKAVAVRAKELDRILKDLQINTSLGLKESVDLVISITSDTTQEQSRCRQSPTFQDSIECSLAMQEFARIAAKLKAVFPRLLRLVLLLTTGNRRGLDIQATRRVFNTLLREAQQDAFDLQVSLADLRDKCKCPDI